MEKSLPNLLIIGTGIAGLSAALKCAAWAKVTVVCKADLMEGSTRYAQGGIASVWSSEDSFEEHIQDTLIAGAGLCRETIVRICVEEGPARVQELIDLGVAFTYESDSTGYDLHREGGHQKRRILHAEDLTGLEIEKALCAAVLKHPNITCLEHHIAIDLITEDKLFKRWRKQGKCLGAYILNTLATESANRVLTLPVDAVILATGGAGKVYLYTTNPDTATGDGIAIAYRAGAQVSNLEFMQFHPTCLYHPSAKTFLISEALRGEGAQLVNQKGERFMDKTHAMGSLAPRDIVARAIDMEMKRTGDKCVYLDIRHMPSDEIRKKFPNIDKTCRQFGINMATDLIPVVPAAHYTCGGVSVDEWGQTSVPGLYAIGEVACTGLHGANRLASNSLLEGVVFAHRAALRLQEKLSGKFLDTSSPQPSPGTQTHPPRLPEWDSGSAVAIEEQIDIAANWLEIRSLMWNYVGIVRSNRRLERAARRLQLLKAEVNSYYWNYLLTKDLIELRNLLIVAELTVQCAQLRHESRGLHNTVDYPERDDLLFSHDTLL